MIRTYAFDADGTMLDSMKIKARAFRTSFEQHVQAAQDAGALVEAMYLVTGGTPRRRQLAAAAALAGVMTLTGDAYDAWSAAFSAETVRHKPQLFSDVAPAITYLNSQGAYCAVSSSMSQIDVTRALNVYPGFSELFKTVYGQSSDGTFHKGRPHLQRISEESGTPIEQIAFVGDAVRDIELGNEAGAITIARLSIDDQNHNERLRAANAKHYIYTFAELTKFI